jgi:hypothetical protein
LQALRHPTGAGRTPYNQENHVNKFTKTSRPLAWSMALLLAAIVAGCGGGSGGGSAGSSPVLPGAVGQTDPTVSSASPSNLSTNVPTTSNGPGNVVTGKTVTATFTQAMDPLTLASAIPGAMLTFTLKQTTTGANESGTVAMNAGNTVATFTPTAGNLALNTQYTATITVAAKNSLGTAMPNPVEWSFTTAALALPAGQAQVDLGRAAAFALFAGGASAVDLAIPGPGVVGSMVNGNVGLNPFGACNNCNVSPVVPVTIAGEVHNGDQTAIDAQSDFFAAFVDASTRATNACTLADPTNLTAPQGACVGYVVAPGSGGVYLPGLYRSAVSIGLGVSGTITLDAGGDADAVFIFQTDDAITTGVNSTIILQGQAQAKNIWWMAGSAVTISLNSTFRGTAVGDAGASVGIGSTAVRPTIVEGRVFSRTAAATVGEFTTITLPQ